MSGFTRQNRPGGNRTPNLRFWRPTLCQIELLAYSTVYLSDYSRSSGTPIFALSHNLLLASYLVSSMFAVILAELLEFQFRRTLCHTDTRAIIPTAALPTLKPDIFPFAFLFGHRIHPNKARPPSQRISVWHANSPPSIRLAGVNTLVLTLADSGEVIQRYFRQLPWLPRRRQRSCRPREWQSEVRLPWRSVR